MVQPSGMPQEMPRGMMEALDDPQILSAARRGLAAVCCLVLALVVWFLRNPAASWASESSVARVTLLTTNDPDDSRLQGAFAAVPASQRRDATLVALPADPEFRQFRHSRLTVHGRTDAEALANVKQLDAAISDAFGRQGSDFVHDEDMRAEPLLDPHALSVKRGFQWGALGLVLLSAVFLVLAWLQYRLTANPLPASFWLPLALFWGLPFVGPFGLIMLIPTAIAWKLCHTARKSTKASHWPSTVGRITKSEVRVEERSGDEGSQAVNVPCIEYDFSVGGQSYHGSRISTVDDPGGRDVQNNLDRYPAGASVPVYYNPANPQDCVLQQNLPLPAPLIYAIAGAIFMAGAAAAFAFANVDTLMERLRSIFPPGAEPQATLFFLLGAALIVYILMSHRHEAKQALSWPTTPGRVVSSRVESHAQMSGRGQGNHVTVYQAVIEYAYTVKAREYHNTRLSFGGAESTPQAPARAKAKRYPEGTPVTVHYDPADPGSAVLDVKVAQAWLWWLIVAVFVALALHFSALLHA